MERLHIVSTTPESPPESGDEIYLEKSLRHTPTDLLLDDSVSSEVVRAAWRRSFKLLTGTFIMSVLIWIFSGGLADSFTSTTRDDSYVVLIVGPIVGIVLFTISWIAFLDREMQEPISEWCTLLGGKSAAADSVYSHIVGRLRDRQLPVQNHLVRRTWTSFGATGNRLVLVDGDYHVYVSVFSYGTSLYLGWTMWRIRKGRVLLQRHFRSSSNNDNFDSLGRILNLERLKAMREAVHAVCREALHTAIEDVTVSDSYGFPSGMPAIERLPYGSAPWPSTAKGPAEPQRNA
jgi:hypothetical protein